MRAPWPSGYSQFPPSSHDETKVSSSAESNGAPLFQKAAASITTSLTEASADYYQCTGRHFLNYLDAAYPPVRYFRQLRREPHILDWLALLLLGSLKPALAKLTYSHSLIRPRRMLDELAWTQGMPHLARLVRADDIPRPDNCLPRPLSAEHDLLIQRELFRRDDWAGNALLLLRHTGMRIGECLDLPLVCLLCTSQDQWAIHVPLSKLRTERLVPVDAFVQGIVHRLQLLRSQDTRSLDDFLLGRPRGRASVGPSYESYCTRSPPTSASTPASCRISFGTPLPLKCSEPAPVCRWL